MPHCPVVFSKAPLALAALCCFANPAAAQPPRIRVDVDLVRVPFVATDSNGKPIRDLRLEELTITDNGVPEDIRYLWTEIDLPLTVGLVIDISSSQMGFVKAHRTAVERFLSSVIGPADRVLLATVDEQPRLLTGWTSSVDDLLQLAAQIAQDRHAGELFGEPCQPPNRRARRGPRACIGTAIWDGVFHLARSQLSTADGRKALIVLSDGLDLNSSVHSLSSAIEALQSANAAVYTIKSVSAPYLALSPFLVVPALRNHEMEDIAVQTGGLFFKNTKSLDDVYRQIEDDLRSQHILAYTPKEPPTPGAWHRLEIRTTRPGIKVRAQAGYRVDLHSVDTPR